MSSTSSLVTATPSRAQRRRGGKAEVSGWAAMPAIYGARCSGIATGEGVGSCGTAAHRREPVIVTDIAIDPFWDDFRHLADQAGLAACWSTPIVAPRRRPAGHLRHVPPHPRVPQDTDLALARVFTGTAALAIERHHIEQAKVAAEARAGRRGLGLPRPRRGSHHQRAVVFIASEELGGLAAYLNR
jgi:GAF domain-containing protein